MPAVVRCYLPSTFENGNRRCSGADADDVWGSTCIHSCDYGYELRGSSSVTCESDRTWSNSLPSCERRSCYPWTNPFSNGRMSCTNSNKYASVCSFSCNPGYRLVGSSRNTCNGNRQWSSVWPRCDVVRCYLPSTFENGNRRCSGADADDVWGSTCIHSCDYGYELRGSSSATCESDRTWSNSLPSCELSQAPVLEACRVSVTDSWGNDKESTIVGNKTSCDSQQDEAVSTVPAKVYFILKADLNLSVGSPLPQYVSASSVGIVAAKTSLEKKNLRRYVTTVKEVQLNGPPYCQRSISSTNPVLKGSLHVCEGTITVPGLSLRDGESLCATMEASAGGFYNLQDEANSYRGTQTFRNVRNSKRVCFLYDPAKPVHCSQTSSWCNRSSDSILQLSTRLTRTQNISVNIQGWLDPVPTGGSSTSVSGIKKYRLEVHGVDTNGMTLSVQRDARHNTIEWESTASGIFNRTVILPEEDATRLYAVILEVHDKAGNVAYARRLVLYDNTSTVLINSSASLQVGSADPRFRTKRQVVRNDAHFCLNWAGRFYNSELYQNNFLLPVTPDTGRQIHGDYDQQSGPLPVTGTDNVRGIVRFEIALDLDGSPEPTFQEVPDVHAEGACLSKPLNHSEAYRVWIRATDLMGNYKDDNVRLKVDLDGNVVLTTSETRAADDNGSKPMGLTIGGALGATALVSAIAVIVIIII
ncbi:hypothetical protein BaRGS_00006972, partial [Batillaria attramentaria]